MGEAELTALVRSFAKVRESDVAGAPFTIGLRVTVVAVSDGTVDDAWIGRSGLVEHYEYDCGSGQTFPHDPMIGVRFDDGQLEEFWPEELKESSDHA